MSLSSCQIDARIDATTPISAAAAAAASSYSNPPYLLREEEPLAGCKLGGSCVSDRFLHSDENLKECAEDEADENDDGPNQSPSDNVLPRRRFPHIWANRQLHRSVSVDDLMEYQREFRLEDVGRASSSYDLTDYQREFQSILAEQQHDCLIPTTPSSMSSRRLRHLRRVVRKSIANSDLTEFKRRFCQERAAETNRTVGSAEDARGVESKTVTDKLCALKDTALNYQWGTRSLRRAILGSDLGTFERSVRTALLESSRENSFSGSIESVSLEDETNHFPAPMNLTASPSSLVVNHRDSHDVRPAPTNLSQDRASDEDWGTRSLRKSLKELDVCDQPVPAASSYRPKPIPSNGAVHEGEVELPRDASLSPWNEGKACRNGANGFKMPRRLVSNDGDLFDGPKHKRRGKSQQDIANPASTRSASVNDAGPLGAGATEPEFEWQLPSRFRRSISSSDIEKYQRHFDGHGKDIVSERVAESAQKDVKAKKDPIDDRSANVVSLVESISTARSGVGQLHPLLSPASRPLITSDDDQNNDDDNNDEVSGGGLRMQHGFARRRHRRSTSDEPELHMEDVIADVAPRKPTRTTSRPISPPPPRSAVVRFADNCTQVVEIPKVSDDMKPYLFYTKRDVKRFRMNEHRRQELQIRSYVEYLNQKKNVLDASPCIFD